MNKVILHFKAPFRVPSATFPNISPDLELSHHDFAVAYPIKDGQSVKYDVIEVRYNDNDCIDSYSRGSYIISSDQADMIEEVWDHDKMAHVYETLKPSVVRFIRFGIIK